MKKTIATVKTNVNLFQIHADTAGQVRRGSAAPGQAGLLPGQHHPHLLAPRGHPAHREDWDGGRVGQD